MSGIFEIVVHAIHGALGVALILILAKLVGIWRELGTDVVVARLFLAKRQLIQSIVFLFAGLFVFVSLDLVEIYLAINDPGTVIVLVHSPMEIGSMALNLVGAMLLWTVLRARPRTGPAISAGPGDVGSRD
ncbi:MAG: hypothetical protein WC985_10765 [Thermoplasmata archaeon]